MRYVGIALIILCQLECQCAAPNVVTAVSAFYNLHQSFRLIVEETANKDSEGSLLSYTNSTYAKHNAKVCLGE